MRRLYVGTIGIMMAAAMALSGCGPTASTENTTGAGAQAAGTQAEAQDGEKIKLVYWSNQRHDMEYVQKKIDEFNSTNDMNIEVSYEAMTENYDNNLELSFQSNQAPDIFRAKSEITPYIKKDMIIPLDEYLTDEDREKYGDTLGVQNINMYDGKIYSLPQFGNTFRLIYNKDVFEKAGLDPEAPPKSMEELREYAKIITEKLSSEGVYGFAMNLKNSYSALYRSLDEVARLSDMFYYDFEEGKYNFDEYAKIAQVFADMYQDGSFFPGCESLDIDPLRAQFALGNIGMYMSGYWEVAVYDSQFPTEQNWAASVLPTYDGVVDGVNTMNSAGRSFVISSQTKHPKEAYEFMKFMTSDDYMIGYHEQGYGIIVVPSVAEKAKPATAYGAEYFTLNDTDTIAPLAPEMAGLVIEGKTFYDAFASVIFGEMSVEDAVAQMTESYNGALEEAISSGDLEPIIVK
ncbi:ABC transporter substrate-binding protein [Lacrimispora sp. 210928-DFI.3.58]|uniref:ABC transporter substrate-binding protein n=1 Tax=Lacrimispora sp. 210928-DFI.3.58 TaxID=2883214 RepID=UPI001D07A117|nr:sugar ABC transporter substrate-binding protein [Lacrimispora sp. 210928-DFI.3.58]MCB7318942.1 sugar ABC transporter substrate-binding protein [Lacrimispora sp. 210928-DFI.3.58]